MPLSVVILAAGQGTRMKSQRPKVIHHLAGKPLLQHVIDASRTLAPDQIIVVVGHHSDQVKDSLAGQEIDFVEQLQQLGTGHAVAQCLPQLSPGNDVLVLYGDVPLTTSKSLNELILLTADSDVGILSFIPEDSFGYGRIVRDDAQNVVAIVEQKDASDAEQAILESNSGIMLIKGGKVGKYLSTIDNENAQSEYYLTDVVKIAVAEGGSVTATICSDPNEVNGVNNQQQLAMVESLYRARQAESLMLQGTKLYDPARIDVRGTLSVGQDVEIDVNCVFEGDVVLGDNVRIAANCVIRNSSIGANSQIHPMTSIDEAVIGQSVNIGPFARLRPGSECADGVKIGNFVETKKSQIGQGSKISHLSYIGDTEMGKGVNIGAGTITCNYDGVNKSKTIIEDGVFVGSNTQLIAPVRIARNATIGAGSIITKDSPAEKLTLSRAKQMTIDSWVRPVKKEIK